MRTACSSYDGNTSTMSPRTRKVPRSNSMSFRSYWISTSFLRTSCRDNPLTARQRQHHAVVGLGRAEAVDARHAGDDDDVAALEERPRGRQAHAVDLVVDRRFLLDVRVARRDVRLGLVVVVVADEVLDGVLGKEALELLVELRRQGLVVRHHQRRPVHARDDLRHRERLARSGDAEQHLVPIAAVESLDELRLRARLIAAELEVGDEMESVGG